MRAWRSCLGFSLSYIAYVANMVCNPHSPRCFKCVYWPLYWSVERYHFLSPNMGWSRGPCLMPDTAARWVSVWFINCVPWSVKIRRNSVSFSRNSVCRRAHHVVDVANCLWTSRVGDVVSCVRSSARHHTTPWAWYHSWLSLTMRRWASVHCSATI